MRSLLIMTIRESVDVRLTELELGEGGTVDRIALPADEAHFLMRIGFVPGAEVRFSRRAPLGDPSVYSVDGTEIALRAETARHIMVQREIVQSGTVQDNAVEPGMVGRDGHSSRRGVS
jgi:Fe2+ transport system protein FeoA